MSENISLLQEIDEALRADKAIRFWQRYGKVVVAGCVGIVVLTAVSAYWKNHLREVEMQHTHMMLKAGTFAANEQYGPAVSGLEESKDWPASMTNVMKLQKANILFKAGQRDQAAALLKEVAGSSSADTALKDIASLRLHMQTGETSFGNADADGRPFNVLAGQIKAAELLEAGKNQEAAEVLKRVTASAAPLSVEQDRANELLQLSGEGETK